MNALKTIARLCLCFFPGLLDDQTCLENSPVLPSSAVYNSLSPHRISREPLRMVQFTSSEKCLLDGGEATV